MGRTEKMLKHPSALSNDLDWRSSVPDKDSTTRLIPLTQGKFATVDAADFDWLNQWNWRANKSLKTFYAMRDVSIGGGRQRSVMMHRLIAGAIDGKVHVDHANGDGLDNRRCNLRLATYSQNGANRGPQKNSKSGIKGVRLHKQSGKWYAQIQHHGKRIHLGSFSTAEAAQTAYIEAAKKYQGEFSGEQL